MDSVKKAETEGLQWLGVAISIAALFGKRVTEILSLSRNQFIVKDGFLFIRFRVGKKRDKNEPIPHFYLKRKTLKHPLTKYIIDFISPIKEGYIFPSSRHEQAIKQKVMVKRKDGSLKQCEYSYTVPGGFISRQLALYYLKKISPTSWFHLFRESLATSMAEEGASEEELMHWFDWDTPASAHKYVKRGTKLTEKWSSDVPRDYVGMV